MTFHRSIAVLRAACGLACALAMAQVDDAAARQGGTPGDGTGVGVTAIAVHGGAGTIRRGDFPPEREAEYVAALEDALRAGYAILEAGGSSLDAVVEAVRQLEDSPLFNAGRGAVFTAAGTHELDASVMDGRNLAAGAVAAVRRVKNPVLLARAVMEQSPHVLLVAEGAEAFAAEQGIELVDPSYFFSAERWVEFERRAGRGPASGPAP
ncbi:MAG TPA: isoaspartyl peptidase/L-asparaginase, partial [Longimicrobiales bacterium]|nr:isoaspartyl peptidase/L-asparaginase [Longimicrobiales bacterium]